MLEVSVRNWEVILSMKYIETSLSDYYTHMPSDNVE